MNVADITPVLTKYRDRSVNYGRALFDHLPMSVDALARMGATDGRIDAWARRYAEAHALRVAGERELAGRERWRAAIGRYGRAGVIAEFGNSLMGGIGAAAFHAAIRAAYAVERSDDRDLAASLESWEREYLPLRAPALTRTVSAEAALSVLAAESFRVPIGGLIAERMIKVGENPRFAAIGAEVPPREAIGSLALAAAAAFASSGNFTALHVMTGTHAMLALLPLLPDPAAAMPAFWRAYAAAALVGGALPTLDPNLLDALRSEAPSRWEPLLEAACRHDDEHVIKSTYTAWRLDTIFGDGVYRTAACRYLETKRG